VVALGIGNEFVIGGRSEGPIYSFVFSRI